MDFPEHVSAEIVIEDNDIIHFCNRRDQEMSRWTDPESFSVYKSRNRRTQGCSPATSRFASSARPRVA